MTAALRTVPLHLYPARRIALLKPSALGDIVHSLPVLTALRRRYPQAHITWVVNRAYEPLLRNHPDLDATLPFDRAALRSDFFEAPLSYLQFVRRLRAARFDLVIDLQGLLRSGLMALASGAARRIGLSGAREGAVRCYTDVVTDREDLHAVERYRQVAAALGAADAPVTFRLPVPDDARTWALEALRDCPRPWLALGAGRRWPTKRWPPEHFAALARRAQANFGGTVVLVGRDDERPLAHAAARGLPGPVHDLTGATTLPRLAAVLSLADVMLANDSGPTHLAAALGRPVVSPYTCTKAARHGPYAVPGAAVESQVWCQGSYRRRCGRLECMAELTPDRLWPHLEEVLLAWQTSDRPA